MIRINLLPHARLEKVKIEVNRQLVVIGLVLVVVLVACGGLWWLQRSKIGRLRADLADADREIKRLEKVMEQDAELNKLKKDVATKLSTIMKLKRGQTGPVHILDDLARSLSDQLWLTDFSEKDGKIALTGVAFSNVSIANFMKNLEGSPYFQNVELGGTTLSESDGRDVYGFTINCEQEGREVVQAEKAEAPRAAPKKPRPRKGGEE